MFVFIAFGLILSLAVFCFAVVFILVNQWIENGPSRMLEHSQLFGGSWPWAYEALGFSCGYFAYDQWDMLHYRLYSGWIPPILLHHLILLICFTLALYRNVTINYLILTLICEVQYIALSILAVVFVVRIHIPKRQRFHRFLVFEKC